MFLIVAMNFSFTWVAQELGMEIEMYLGQMAKQWEKLSTSAHVYGSAVLETVGPVITVNLLSKQLCMPFCLS